MKKSNEKITVKNNKHSIDKSNVTTFRSEYIGDFYNFRTRQNCPMTLAGIERLADRMLKWVESPDAIKFNQFLAKENMLYEDFSRFLDKSEDLKKTHKAVIRMIGDNREVGAADFKKEKTTMHKVMWRYDEHWDETDTRLAKIQSQNPSQTLIYPEPMYYCKNCNCDGCVERNRIFIEKENEDKKP